jgi:dUTP pyrophosphatase
LVELSVHPDVTLEVLKKCYIPVSHEHPNFTFEWVEAFPNRFWDWNALSRIAPIGFVATHLDYFWNWRIITSITPYDVMIRNVNLPWDFTSFVPLRKITEDDLIFFRVFTPVIPLYKWAHFVKYLPWKVFVVSLDLPWIWEAANVSLEGFEVCDMWVLYRYSFLFDWIKLTVNINIDIINDYPELSWDSEYISWNKGTWTTPVEPVEVSIRRWVAAKTIQRYWKRAISCPSYKICARRLIYEFKDLRPEYYKKRMASVRFFKLSPDAIIPSKATPGSIGLDLHSISNYVVMPGQRVVVSTGLRAFLPDGVYGRIAPRSGLAVKHGLDVGAGVIDQDYTGELRVVLFNHDLVTPFIIKPGYRIAQLILEQALDPVSSEIFDFPNEQQQRGGFGSTGV